MKKLDLKILDNADKQTVERIAEMYPSASESERKKLWNRVNLSKEYYKENSCSESGVEIYSRPVWHRFAQFAAAALALAVGLGGTVYAFRNKATVSDPAASVTVDTTAETGIITTEPSSEAKSIVMSDSRFYNKGETCESDGFQYCVNNFEVTKSSSGMTLRQNGYYPCDENGVFTCDYSYMIVDITIKNMTDKQRKFYTNSSCISCYNYDQNGSYDEMFPDYGADVYNFNGEKSILAADFFAVDLQPGETKDFRIGYILEDSKLDSIFDLLCIELTGQFDTHNRRFCIIGENTSFSQFRALDDLPKN